MDKHNTSGVAHTGKISGHEIKLPGSLPIGHTALKRTYYTYVPLTLLDSLFLNMLEKYVSFYTLTRRSSTLDQEFAPCV